MQNIIDQNAFQTFSLAAARKDVPQVSKQIFTVKQHFANKRYTELELFRQQIEQSKAGIHHQPYTHLKKNVLFYKTAFFAFGALFGILGITAMNLNAVGCSFFFSCTAVKGSIVTVSLLFSLLAMAIGYVLSIEREAVFYTVRKAKAILSSSYARKRMHMGIKRFFAMGSERRQLNAIKQMYHDVYEKINDKKEEALHLTHRIAYATSLSKEQKELLLNQALEELHDKLRLLTHSFKHAALPHLS